MRGNSSVISMFEGPGTRNSAGLFRCLDLETLDADDTTTDPQAARRAGEAQQSAGHDGVPAKTRRVHARLHNDAEKAKLRVAEGCTRPADQRLRGYELYSRGRAQSAGALGGADPRRPREGSARRPLSHHSRRARYARRGQAQTAPF